MGIIKELWDLGKEYIVPNTASKWKSKFERKRILKSFAVEFTDHSSNETEILDYYSWHEKPSDLKSGTGRLLSVTHKEIARLWSQISIIAPYEAFLLRHLSEGGVMSRIFVLGAEYVDPKVRMFLLSVLYRHNVLGFSPKIVALGDMKQVSKNLFVDCDMFGVLNDFVAYYFKFPVSGDPIFVRTTEPLFINFARRCHTELEKRSKPFDSWYKGQPLKLSPAKCKEIELECRLIFEIANYKKK